MTVIRPARARDVNRLVAINNAVVPHVNALTPAEMVGHLAMAWLFLVIETATGVTGFVVVLDQDADYDSPNFLWFRARYRRFCYVDRIAVDPEAEGGGLGRQLYEAVFALLPGHDLLTCEVNLDPPNPRSIAVHQRLGFEVVGEQMANGKHVALMARPLDGAAMQR